MAELLQHFFDISHIYTVEYHRKVSNSSNKHNTCKILTDLQDCNDIANNISRHSVVASTWAMFFIDLCTATSDRLQKRACGIICYICAFSCCIGHCYPIFFNFKGGKIVACLAGICIITNWILTLIGLVVFFIILILTKYVSLSSIITSICLFIFTFIPFVQQGMILNLSFGLPYSIFMGTICLLLIVRHHANIKRLFKGEESKIKWLSRNK